MKQQFQTFKSLVLKIENAKEFRDSRYWLPANNSSGQQIKQEKCRTPPILEADYGTVRDRLPCNLCAARVAEALVSRLPVPSHGHLSRYSILTWNIKEGLPYATAYHSPSAPIMKYTSCW